MATILVIDDQPCVRALLTEELMLDGYEVESAGDAESAQARVRSLEPDLVLLDLYLDGPEGWDVLGDIKRHAPHLPVLIVTAYDSFQDDPRLSQADGYVIKSVGFVHLKQEIARLLNSQRGARGNAEVHRGLIQGSLAHSV